MTQKKKMTLLNLSVCTVELIVLKIVILSVLSMNGIAYLMISKNLLVFLVLSTKLNHFLVIVIYFEQISSVWGTPWLVPTSLDLNLVTTTFTKRLSLLNHINILLFKKKNNRQKLSENVQFWGVSATVDQHEEGYNAKYATNQNLCRPFSRTNYGLARFSLVASQTWEATATKIKRLPLNSFEKEY